MPQLLKRSTIRLIESSVENLNYCIEIIQKPNRIPIHYIDSFLSIPTGLLGISFELLCSAIVVQVHNDKKLLIRENGYYKTASQILDELKDILTNPTPKLSFLTQGIKDKNGYLISLKNKFNEFSLMAKLRASAVHSAISPSKEVVIIYINKLLNIYTELKKSNRISGYLNFLPSLSISTTENNIIIEDLIRSISEEKNIESNPHKLVSLFLVLPEVPTYKPEWLEKISNVNIAPKKDDIAFLLKVLGECESVNLVKRRNTGSELPVSIQQGNPNALPIDPHYIRKEFTKFKDQFYADISTANGRLNQKQLDLPPIDSVYYIVSNRIEVIEEKFNNEKMSHLDSWPFIIRSMSQQGTIGPYWYFVRKTENISQLTSYLNKAFQLATGYLKRRERKHELFSGIDCLLESKTNNSYHVKDIEILVKNFNDAKTNFENRINSSSFRSEHPEYYEIFSNVISGDNNINYAIEKALNDSNLNIATLKTWIKYLVEIAESEEDLLSIIELLKDNKFSAIYTNIRKAIRRIDFLCYGPSIEIDI